MLKFLSNVIESLEQERKLSLEHIVFVNRQLRDVLIDKVKKYVADAKKEGYQAILGFKEYTSKEPEKYELNLGSNFEFKEEYPVIQLYEGSYSFQKHYHKILSHMNGEEEECAMMIDNHPNVDVWIRNLDRNKDNAFWLQTSTDKFYPDFIAKLKDGTLVIIEYKNTDDYTKDDSKEKKIIGELYSSISKSKIRFIMLKGKDWVTLREILNAK